MNTKIDKTDLKILNELDKKPLLPINLLAKNINISRQVASYRLNNLINKKIIYHTFTLIDLSKTGQTLFRIHLSLKNPKKIEEIAKNIFDNYNTFWVAFVLGSFDLIIDIFSENETTFFEVFEQFLEKEKENISEHEISILLWMNIYNYNIFNESLFKQEKIKLFKKNIKEKIDEIDSQILKSINKNARKPYEQIAKEINLTRNAVKERIKKLEKKQIIAGYKTMLNFNLFKKNSYKIFLKYDTTKKDQEEKLVNYISESKGVLATVKLLGNWNLDVEIHTDDAKQLQEYIITLRNQFPIIKKYEIIQIISDYGINFYPNKI
jgi:DNA-binding Lrp family transcriptional regulator